MNNLNLTPLLELFHQLYDLGIIFLFELIIIAALMYKLKGEKSWYETIEFYFIDNPLAVFLIMPALVLLVVYMYGTAISYTINVNNPTILSILDISSSMLIAYITLLYVLFTWKLVSQSKESIKQSEESIKQSDKHNKINYIQKQIEEFYYPFKAWYSSNVNVHYQDSNGLCTEYMSIADLVNKQSDSNTERINENNFTLRLKYADDSDYYNLLRHRYLYKKNSKEIFDEFFSLIEMRKDVQTRDLRSMGSFLIKLDQTIDNDINALINELSILVDSDSSQYTGITLD